jgi:hypothetical protein
MDIAKPVMVILNIIVQVVILADIYLMANVQLVFAMIRGVIYLADCIIKVNHIFYYNFSYIRFVFLKILKK